MQDHWYKKGLRFECTQCGNCCTGPSGHIWFTEEEGRALAASLDLTEDEFLREYAHQEGGRWTLKEKPHSEHGFDCIFLDRSDPYGRVGCSVYGQRPNQCRTWPFWPANLSSAWAWDRVKLATPCPGMGQGPLHQVPGSASDEAS